MVGARQSCRRMLALALAWALVVLAVGSANAQTAPPPLPVEVFFSRPDMSDVRLSPSGRYLSVLMPGPNDRNTLAVVDLVDNTQSKALTRYDDADIADVRWVDDDWLVFHLDDYQTGGGRRDFAPGLVSISRAGGAPRVLVKVRGNPFITAAPVGVDRRLDYNHMLLAVPRDGSREVIVGEMSFTRQGYIDDLRPKRLNVENGRTRSIENVDIRPVDHWMFNLRGEPLLAAHGDDGRVKMQWREPGGKTWTPLLDADSLHLPWTPHSVDNAGTLYVTDSRGEGGTSVLSRFDFARRAPAAEPTVVVKGFDFQGSLVVDGADGRAVGVRALTDAETTVWLDPALKTLQDEVDKKLPGSVNRINCRRCDNDDRVVLIESWSDQDPGTYFVMRGRPGVIQRVGRRMKAVDPRRMALLYFERIKARDGRDLPLWFTEPARAEGAPPPPAVVLVHGGPWMRGGSWNWHALPQFLASRGYAVIEPEFRGSAGYGAAHFRAGWRQWGQAMQDDVSDALRWAIAEKRVDGKRVCIAGGSYGGYATLMGLVRDPDQYRCGAAWAAVSEPMRMLESSWWWSDDISDEARGHSLPAMLGDPKTDAAMLKAISPLQQAARIKAPVLLVHGEQDQRVPFIHAKEMREALRKGGQEPEWLVFPDETHGWNKTENQRAFARKLESFLAKHLK